MACAAGAAQAQGAAWWIGFVDTRNHAFLELPNDPKACAAREAQLPAGGAPGTLAIGTQKIDAFVPPGARLLFGVSDLRGRYGERVLTHVAAVARESGTQGACWYLAEPGIEAQGYVAEEDVLAFATLPPRALTLRAAADDWRAYGATKPEAQSDARFAAMDDAPADWRTRMAALLPGYTQVYGQSLNAVLEKGGAPQPLALIGAINDGLDASGKGQAYNTVNLIARAGQVLYQAGPSGGVEKNRAGSFVAQAVTAVDLDGDGVDEIVLRARYFTGGNLKVLKWADGKFTEIRQSAYEGE